LILKPPILKFDDLELMIAESPEILGFWMELPEADDKGITIYDSQGHLLKRDIQIIEIEKKILWFTWKSRFRGIVITEYDPIVDHSEELRNKILEILTSNGYIKEEILSQSLLRSSQPAVNRLLGNPKYC